MFFSYSDLHFSAIFFPFYLKFFFFFGEGGKKSACWLTLAIPCVCVCVCVCVCICVTCSSAASVLRHAPQHASTPASQRKTDPKAPPSSRQRSQSPTRPTIARAKRKRTRHSSAPPCGIEWRKTSLTSSSDESGNQSEEEEGQQPGVRAQKKQSQSVGNSPLSGAGVKSSNALHDVVRKLLTKAIDSGEFDLLFVCLWLCLVS